MEKELIDPESNPWTVKETTTPYSNPWIEVKHHQVLNPAGNSGIYGVVHFKNLALGCVPVDEAGHTWLVGQFRFPLNKYTWEIPEGGGPLQADPLQSIQRELEEECGLIAKKWTLLQTMDLSNSATTEHAMLWLAQDLELGSAEPEETEQLQIKKLPLREAFEMVHSGEITDSLSVVALLKLEYLLLTKQLDIKLDPLSQR